MDEDKRRRLYDQGLSDEVIAKRSGVARVTITAWRLARGLPVNKHPPHQLSNAEERHRMALWKKGLPDVLIAAEVGLTPGAIMRWRQRHGLKGNDFTKWKRKHRAAATRKSSAKRPTRRGTRTRPSPTKRRSVSKRTRPTKRSARKRSRPSKRRSTVTKPTRSTKRAARKR